MLYRTTHSRQQKMEPMYPIARGLVVTVKLECINAPNARGCMNVVLGIYYPSEHHKRNE